MAAVLSWFRLDVRRRWRSLVVLTLLVAVSAGTVMTAVAGAKRGASAVDRLLAETLPATVLVQSNNPGLDWEEVRGRPEVEALGEVAFSGFEIDGEPAGESMVLPPADGEVMWTIERPVVLDGRLADPARSDEVVVTPGFADTHGKGVGDTVAIGLYAPEQIDVVQGPDATLTNLDDGLLGLYTPEQLKAALDADWDINDTAPAAGPVVDATIVGIVHSFWFGDRLDRPGYLIPSAALFAEHTPHFLGAEGLAATGALVRLDGGAAAIPGFRQDLASVTGLTDMFVGDLTASAGGFSSVTGFEANSLFIFAAVAGTAAIVLLGLAVARFAGSTVPDLQLLRAVGMTPRQTRLAAAAGPTLATVAGTALGAIAAVVASRWFPLGSASVVEPSPGVDVDLGVLAAGLIGIPLLAAAGGIVAVALAMRSTGPATSPRRSAVATAAATAGFPVPIVVGSRFALEPGRGRRAVPVRPALLGAVAGVTGVLAAFTFSHAVDDAATNPARFGYVNQAEAYVGFNNLQWAPAEPVFAAFAETPGVIGVQDVIGHLAEAGDQQIVVSSAIPVGAPHEYIVTGGRLPVGPTETLLGLRAAAALGAGIGDTVTLTGTVGEAELVVVGLGVIDAVDAAAMTTRPTYESLFGDAFMFRYGDVGLEPDVEFEAAVLELYEALAPVAGAGPDNIGIVPQELTEDDVPAGLRFLRPLPVFLAGFLVVLALGAVGHALAAAVRRRSYDMAVLRAVGMGLGQSRGVVATQAAVLALVGLIVGIPLGIALGRVIWRYIAETMFIHYVPPVAVLVVALIVPGALLAAILLAAWPSHRAASLPVADILRAE
jgi:hypothetical protein